VLASALAGGLGFLSTQALPRETQIIISLDVFLFTFVTLVYVLMSTATAEQCAELAMKGK